MRFACGLQKGFLQRIVGAQFVHRQRSILAVITRRRNRHCFPSIELGKHVGIRPAGVAQLRPLMPTAPSGCGITAIYGRQDLQPNYDAFRFHPALLISLVTCSVSAMQFRSRRDGRIRRDRLLEPGLVFHYLRAQSCQPIEPLRQGGPGPLRHRFREKMVRSPSQSRPALVHTPRTVGHSPG